MTGHGGWPLTAFLDPEGVPFYGGTYFPPEPRQGMPSFRMVMEAVVESWSTQRERIRASAARIREQLGAIGRLEPSAEPLSPRAGRHRAVGRLRMMADMRHGGFGGAPKFPPAAALELLLAHGVERRRRGDARRDGPRRHLRPDRRRLRPLLGRRRLARPPLREDALRQRAAGPRLPPRLAGARPRALAAGLRARRSTGRCARCAGRRAASTRRSTPTPRARRAASTSGRRTRFARRSAPPAWASVADEVIAYFGVTEEGNFEGRNILHVPGRARPPSVPSAWTRRAGRSASAVPNASGRASTTSASASWNALMIAALAEAGAVLGARGLPGRRRGAARSSSGPSCAPSDGRLRRSWKDGEARLGAYLEDYAYLVEALLTLYEATFEVRWFDAARQTADLMIELFADSEHGGFFTTAHDHERLIARRKDVDDHPIPSGNSSAAYGLLRLAALTGEHEYERHAVGVFRLLHEAAARHPHALAHLLRAMDFHFASVKEVALVAPPARAATTALRPTPRRPGRRGALGLPPLPGARRRARGHRAARADARALGRGRAGRPPTCARTSPAGARSPSPKSWRRPSARLSGATGRARPRGVDAVGPTEEDDRCPRIQARRPGGVELSRPASGRQGAEEAHVPHGRQRPRRRVEGRSPLSSGRSGKETTRRALRS